MAFTVSINAARMLVATPGFDPASPSGITLEVRYALCQYTPAADAVPATITTPAKAATQEVWTDMPIGRTDQACVMSPTSIPTPADIAAIIKADVLAKFGSSVETVSVNGQLF